MDKIALPFGADEINRLLPVVVSDMKHSRTKAGKRLTNTNIRACLYHAVILSLYEPERFLSNEMEPDDQGRRMGCFIKGYVREVWQYLEDAYELIHRRNFVPEARRLLRENPNL